MPVSSETLVARIRTAMGEAGLTQQTLATSIGLDPSALSRALSGQRNFKSLEVALIAEKLGVSVQSLLSDAPSHDVLMAARTQPDSSPALASALATADYFMELERLLADLGLGWTAALNDVGELRGHSREQGEELSAQVRRDMGIGEKDLPYELSELAGLLESTLGLDVGFEPLPIGLDGLSVACEGFRLAIVSSGVSATRQRFTLAHEIGHLAAGDSQDLRVDENVYGRHTPEEERANAFAASFLMPANVLRESMPRGFASEVQVAELLGRFGVSLDALAFRLHNVGIVNAAGRDRIRSMSSNRIALRSGRVSDLQARGDRRVPGNLLIRTVEAYAQGKISIRPLAKLLGVPADQLLEELAPTRRLVTADDVDSIGPAL